MLCAVLMKRMSCAHHLGRPAAACCRLRKFIDGSPLWQPTADGNSSITATSVVAKPYAG